VIIVKKVKNEFAKVQRATQQDVADLLYQEAEVIMTASKRYYVPVVTGALRNSGTVLRPVITDDSITVTLGFGGDAAPYAAIVHEYPKSYGQGRNKYLSIPLNISVKGMANRIAKALERKMRGRP
jgi:hypothetical protein